MGVSSFRGSYLLPPVLNAFRLEHPDVKVEIVEQNSMVLEQQLLSGEIDIALLVMSEADPRLNIEWVLKDEICLITSHTYAADLFKAPVILTPENYRSSISQLHAGTCYR